MAGLVDNLIDTLEKQYTIYENLVGLGKEKKEVIILNEVDQLQKITSLENTLIIQNSKLDKNRVTAFSDIANVLGLNENDLTLRQLVKLIEGKPEHDRLLEITNKTKTILDELKEVNIQNQALVESALDCIDYSLNVYRSAMNNEPSMYSSSGEEISNNRSFFDAKQ